MKACRLSTEKEQNILLYNFNSGTKSNDIVFKDKRNTFSFHKLIALEKSQCRFST